MTLSDHLSTFFFFALMALVALLYLLRVAMRGFPTFERIDRQGSSKLLHKRVMEMAYWAMQPFAELMIFFNITANSISFASVIFGVLAGLSFAGGHFGSAAIFAGIASMLDALDGMVARNTNSTGPSLAGKVLDSALDRYVEFFSFAGLAAYYRFSSGVFMLTLLALFASFMVSYSTALGEVMNVEIPRGSMRRPERLVYLIIGAAISPLSITYLEHANSNGRYMAYPMIAAIALIAIVGNLSVAGRLTSLLKTLQEKDSEVRADDPSDKLKVS